MQTVSIGDNLHEMSNPVFWLIKNKKKMIYLSSAELAQRVIKAKGRHSKIHAIFLSAVQSTIWTKQLIQNIRYGNVLKTYKILNSDQST